MHYLYKNLFNLNQTDSSMHTNNQSTLSIFWRTILASFIILFFLISCSDNEKVNINFSRIYIFNFTSQDAIDRITNIMILDYNDEMADTITEMDSVNINTKNTGYSNFINRTNYFPWNTVSNNSTSIDDGQSYSIFRNDCNNSIIIRIENGYNNNINEYYKKYHYALFNPIGCGFNHLVNITNTNAP